MSRSGSGNCQVNTVSVQTYDLRGRITSLAYGNGASVNLAYEEDDDLASIGHAFPPVKPEDKRLGRSAFAGLRRAGWPLAGGGTGIEYTHEYTKAGRLKGKAANGLAIPPVKPEDKAVVAGAGAIRRLCGQHSQSVHDGDDGLRARDDHPRPQRQPTGLTPAAFARGQA